MATMPNYEQWIRNTYSRLHKRSDKLKLLDEAVKAYVPGNPASKAAVKKALDDWKFDHERRNGANSWKDSVRNKKGAVTNLYRCVNDLDKRQLSQEEIDAMIFIASEQQKALAKLFRGKELTFKPTTVVGLAQGAGTNWQKFKTGATAMKQGHDTVKGMVKTGQSIHDGAKLLREGGRAAAVASGQADITAKIAKLCKTLTPGMDPDKVFQHLNLGSVSQFAGNVAPFVGAISSGKDAVVGWIGVAQTAYTKHDISERRFAFAPQDPEAAFDAVLECIRRDMESRAIKAGTSTAVFTGKLLGSFADAGAVTGPVLGLLETLANIFQTIVEYVRDYKEVERANKLLTAGHLNLDLFGASPILGCYFLLVSDHSTIINFAVADYGTPNFVFDAERLVMKVNPVLDKAREYVGASRYEIVGFDGMKGVVEKNWSKQGKIDKIKGLPGHVLDLISGKVSELVMSPEGPPKVDKSRIVGFGSDSPPPP